MSCGKVYQASEVNKLFLMRFASIHGEASYLGLAGAGGRGRGALGVVVDGSAYEDVYGVSV